MDSVRLDKWLWAARFYKTRSIAREQIDGGKVRLNGQRAKPSKELKGGELVSLRQGYDELTVVVRSISDKRRGAPEARLLYEETADSLSAREKAIAERKAGTAAVQFDQIRPNKKQRRQIHRFKRIQSGTNDSGSAD